MRAQRRGQSCQAVTATEQLKALSGIACTTADNEAAPGLLLLNL
jgi:hypothetical protein